MRARIMRICLRVYALRTRVYASPLSIHGGDRPLSTAVELLVSVLTRNASYVWFNKLYGMRPCPLYTPPVALTDGLLCEYERLRLRGNSYEQGGLKEREVVTRHR